MKHKITGLVFILVGFSLVVIPSLGNLTSKAQFLIHFQKKLYK